MGRLTISLSIIYFAGLLAHTAALRGDYAYEAYEGSAARGARIFGLEGPKLTDVAQGELGTCYFLAAIASIAQKHPDIISEMFVKRELWNGIQPVYTTRWLLNGKEHTVAVDGWVPADELTHQPFFVNVNDGADFWPLILEKAWAKIFGSFKAVSGGFAHEAFKAITQAPFETIDVEEEDKATVWMKLKVANPDRSNFPAIATISKPNAYNLAYPHAYSLLEVSDNYNGHGKAVRLNNPWGTRNRYCGRVPNPDQKQGSFWIGFDEFLAAVSDVEIAKVQSGYHVTAETIPTASETTTVALEFEMHDDSPFSVQLEWPGARYTPDCPILSPVFEMGVAKADDLENAVFAKKAGTYMSNARADLKGKGKYVVFVNMAFQHGAWLKEVVVNVYAAERPTITQRDQNAWDVFLKMTGLCKTISVKDAGKYAGHDGTFVMSDKRVNGFPVFEPADDMVHPQMQLIYYSPEKATIVKSGQGWSASTRQGNGWQISGGVAAAEKGEYFPGAFNDVTCVEASLLQTADQAAGLAEVGLVYGSTEARKVEMPTSFFSVTTALESRASCDVTVSRLLELNNWEEIQTGRDSFFPTNLHSIGAGENCGDIASGKEEPCDKYNHWEAVSSIHLEMQNDLSEQREMAKCLVGKVVNEHGEEMCHISNNCQMKRFDLKGVAPSYNVRVGADVGPMAQMKGHIAHCEVLSDQGGKVMGFTLPEPCA
mmetsp:Transcript_11840/g.26217  ORF Transcript_11840/g.26217 Transcript_11840/m.26217 type:complete len:712 (+) Transcript_11840:64-2199(+)